MAEFKKILKQWDNWQATLLGTKGSIFNVPWSFENRT
jgi:hypothetical protein